MITVVYRVWPDLTLAAFLSNLLPFPLVPRPISFPALLWCYLQTNKPKSNPDRIRQRVSSWGHRVRHNLLAEQQLGRKNIQQKSLFPYGGLLKNSANAFWWLFSRFFSMLHIVFREQWTTPDIEKAIWDFPRSPMVKNPRAIAEDTGSMPGPERCHMPRGN